MTHPHVTALLGARNRFALRLADHQSSRQIVRAGTERESNSAMLLEGLKEHEILSFKMNTNLANSTNP